MKDLKKALKFWRIVEEVSQLSKDPSTKVGALALDENFNTIVTGYNGFPRGVDDSQDRYHNREIKYKLISHAEQNLVAQAAYMGVSLKDSTVLVTALFPCASCAKSLIQAGVKAVIAFKPEDNERWKDDALWASLMFKEAGVHVEYINRS